MRRIWASSRICVLIFSMALGCGAGNDTTTNSSENPSDGTTSTAVTSKGGAPGGPVGTKPGGRAQGSPMKVPAFTAGGSLDSMKPTFEKRLKDACRDGTMCVKINYDVHPAENDESCSVDKVQPSETVNRNSTVTTAVSRSPGEVEDLKRSLHGAAGPSGGFGDVGASDEADRADREIA